MASISQHLVKRHCMVVHAYYPLGEIRVQREAKALIDAGFEVDVICLRRSDEPARAAEYNVQIYRLPLKRYKQYGGLVQLLEYLAFFLLATVQLFKLYLKKHYATIQVHNLPDFLVFSALLPKLMGARVLLDLHDLMPEFYAARFNCSMDTFLVKLVKLQEKLSCWFADHVITVTEAWRQTLIERGVPKEKCSVVMNLPDPGIFSLESAAQTPARPANSLIRLFYHGNVTHRYGLDILVRAFGQVHQQLPQTQLLIHGRGDYQADLKNLVDSLDLGQKVTLSTELIPLEEVVSLIKTADLAIVPYRYDVFTDGILPTKLMEYAALGVPTIVSSSSAVRAYFDENMVYFIPADDVSALAEAIFKVISEQGRLSSLSANIKRFTQIYTWHNESKSYTHLVENIMGKNVAPGPISNRVNG